jgi:hypothetical protein
MATRVTEVRASRLDPASSAWHKALLRRDQDEAKTVPYAVELRSDENLAERARGLWRALEEIGAGSFGTVGEPVPHISLAVYDDEAEVDEDVASGLIAELAARCGPTASRSRALEYSRPRRTCCSSRPW